MIGDGARTRPEPPPGPAGRPPTVPVPAGYRVHCWQVGRAVASGAWGSVYAARRTGHGRPPGAAPDEPNRPDRPDQAPDEVALKFLAVGTPSPRLLALLQDVARREVTGHSTLRHRRLVRTYDVLTVHDPADERLDGSTVLVMELARGSLAELRATAPADGPVPGAARRLAEVADGLRYIHRAGWVHGDLTPSNVLVRTDGTCCLADFGLAAALDGSHAYAPPLASPDFAAPERRTAVGTGEGYQVRPSADVWAFGLVACLTLTGRMPLPGLTPWTRAEAAAEYVAGLRELILPDGLEPGWARLVADCLARDPGDRPTAADLVDRIERIEHAAGRDPRAHRGRRRLAACGVVAVLLGTAGVTSCLRQGHGLDAPQQSAEAPAVRGSTVAPSLARSTGPTRRSMPADTCVPRDQDRADETTGTVWHRAWYCINEPDAPQYATPGGTTVIGWIETVSSWFICYRLGPPGPDGDPVWYYTQGDEAAPGWSHLSSWGYTPSSWVRARPRPYPGMPECPAGQR